MQDLLVERQIGHQAFETPILLPQLIELLELARIKTAVFLLPSVERLFADAVLADQILDRNPGLCLLQDNHDLALGKSRLPHSLPPYGL